MRAFSTFLLLVAGAASSGRGDDALQLPPAQVTLRVDAPDPAGPWKMVVTNQGNVPVRLAADGRLLSFEMPKPEDPYTVTLKKKAKPAPPVVCKLPPELRPSAVIDDRAVVLGPGARYEEVISPALYCFSDASAKALVPGATVTAKLGFAPAARPARKNAPPLPPFAAEPAALRPTVAPLKEIVSEPFVLAAAAPVTPAAPESAADPDPNAPRIELEAPSRVDTANELTVAMTLAVKNVGGRAALVHARRDHLVFDVDGPDGSSHCGAPVEYRRVPRDAFAPLAPGGKTQIDVWVGEMCADIVFDRPGLYRIRPTLTFPPSNEPTSLKVWTEPVTSKDAVLVRVRQGRLPFYTSPPQVFGPSP